MKHKCKTQQEQSGLGSPLLPSRRLSKAINYTATAERQNAGARSRLKAPSTAPRQIYEE